MPGELAREDLDDGAGEEVLRGGSYCIRHRLYIPPRPGSQCYRCFKEKLDERRERINMKAAAETG